MVRESNGGKRGEISTSGISKPQPPDVIHVKDRADSVYGRITPNDIAYYIAKDVQKSQTNKTSKASGTRKASSTSNKSHNKTKTKK